MTRRLEIDYHHLRRGGSVLQQAADDLDDLVGRVRANTGEASRMLGTDEFGKTVGPTYVTLVHATLDECTALATRLRAIGSDLRSHADEVESVDEAISDIFNRIGRRS